MEEQALVALVATPGPHVETALKTMIDRDCIFIYNWESSRKQS